MGGRGENLGMCAEKCLVRLSAVGGTASYWFYSVLSLTFFWHTFVKFPGLELEFDRD